MKIGVLVVAYSLHSQGHTAFGYGRRTCVGNAVSNNTLFVNIATLLWAFNIEKAKDEKGEPITPDVNNFIDHVNIKYVFPSLRACCKHLTFPLLAFPNSHPAPFPANFVYRHPDVPELLAQTKAERAQHL